MICGRFFSKLFGDEEAEDVSVAYVRGGPRKEEEDRNGQVIRPHYKLLTYEFGRD